MGRYVLRRLLESAVTFVLVTIVVFIGVRLLRVIRARPGRRRERPADLARSALVRPG